MLDDLPQHLLYIAKISDTLHRFAARGLSLYVLARY
jgi:hypothetical protein